VYAAGSLRGALTVIAKDFEASTGEKVALTFGASGLLRERIELATSYRRGIAGRYRLYGVHSDGLCDGWS
jgi:hypothetical protein